MCKKRYLSKKKKSFYKITFKIIFNKKKFWEFLKFS